MTTDPFEIIKAPVITEQSYANIEKGKYVFHVHDKATKPEIKKAVQAAFNVTVRQVNVMTVKGKMRRLRFRAGRTPDWKKAIVTLEKGQTIDLL
ncbi:MAG: 50S ribosomal protein L23 [Candidatus Sumerlaeia bacterium]